MYRSKKNLTMENMMRYCNLSQAEMTYYEYLRFSPARFPAVTLFYIQTQMKVMVLNAKIQVRQADYSNVWYYTIFQLVLVES